MNRQDWMGFPLTAVAVAVAVVAAAPALAQNTTSAVGGLVVGLDGKPIAGAAVTVVHTESRATASTVTDSGGRWVTRGLRVGGPYTITVSKAGDTEKREGIYLALAETLSMDLLLGRSAQVTVTGSRILADKFGASNMGATTAIGARDLANLSSLTGNLQDFARIDPRISQTDKERGEISALGQNSRYNNITIDGVNISDTFGLESNNLPLSKQPISIYAIQSVQVNLSNYDVTQTGYTGANINAVTKSGTNEFHGTLYGSHRDESVAGSRYSRPTTAGGNGTYFKPAPFKVDVKGFVLGGPIIQDKLFFFVGYEETKNSLASIDFGPIGSAKTNVGISPALITSLQNVARTTYNVDLGTIEPPGEVFQNIKDALVRLDWTISDSQRAMLRWTSTKEDTPIYPNINSTTLSLSSDWYTQKKTLDTVVGQWFADWTPNFSSEVRASYRDYKSVPDNNSRLPQISFDVNGASTTQPTLVTGTERSRHFNQLFVKTVDGFLGLNWNLGSHEVKGGADFSKNKVFNAFLQDAYGQYKFQCENAYTYTTPLSGTGGVVGSGNSGTCATATPAELEAAIAENFRLGRASAYQAQIALPGKTLDDAIAKWNLNNFGLFLQDTWTIAPKFTLTAGVRVDTLDMPDRPIANAAAAGPIGLAVVTGRGTGTRQTGGFGYDNTVTPDGDSLIQPRLGFNWDLGSKDQKMQLRGGLGLFQGAAANVWLSNPYSNTGIATSFYGCGPSGELSGGTTRAACSTTGGVLRTDVNNQQALGANPAANVDFLDPSLAQPSVWKSNLAFEVQGPAGMVLGAEWIHTKVNKGVYYRNLNLGAVTAYGNDGREMYYNAAGYNTNCWTAAGATAATAAGCGGTAPSAKALSNLSYGNVLLASGSNKGGGDAVTLAVTQQPLPGLTWQMAYTKTRTTEVSPLTSSVSSSNFNARSVFNPNEDVAAASAYQIRDRVNGTVNWEKALFGSLKTTFGVTYEGRSGKNYSWTYRNDLNGDGIANNDLMYIPSRQGSGEVVFAGGAAEEQAFWNIVNQYAELRNSAGKVVGRNSGTSPWVNNFDVRLTQEIPGFLSTHKAKIKFDIFNFGNLINRKWGRTDEVVFASAGGSRRGFVNYKGTDAQGRYIYSLNNATGPTDYTTRQNKGESQWAAQIALSYEF